MLAHISDLLNPGVMASEVHRDTDIREAARLILCVITKTNHAAIAQNRFRHLANAHQERFDMMFRGLGLP